VTKSNGAQAHDIVGLRDDIVDILVQCLSRKARATHVGVVGRAAVSAEGAGIGLYSDKGASWNSGGNHSHEQTPVDHVRRTVLEKV
jgi:hypothetical protein